MKVAEYRELIDACYDALISVKSAATPHEQRTEVAALERAYVALSQAKCPRSGIKDQSRAGLCLMACQKCIQEKRSQFTAADGAFQSMAFGGGWCGLARLFMAKRDEFGADKERNNIRGGAETHGGTCRCSSSFGENRAQKVARWRPKKQQTPKSKSDDGF